MFRYLLIAMTVFAGSFAHATCEEQLQTVKTKLTFSLERTISIALDEQENLSEIQILGALNTTERMLSEEIEALFRDPSVHVRMIIPGGRGNIVTFSSSLAGVLNAAESDKVKSIQMSQKLGGTAGITVRN